MPLWSMCQLSVDIADWQNTNRNQTFILDSHRPFGSEGVPIHIRLRKKEGGPNSDDGTDTGL